MADHEKRIREFLSERSTMRGLCPEQIAGANDSRLNTTDLRALLADLDAVRGALGEIIADMDSDFGTGYDYDKARAALKGASA